jgi:hypothetical protein
MNSNARINFSRQLYTRLLNLYPQEHKDEYGASMLQYFTDQCHEVYAKRGVWSLLSLWFRTLIDLGISSLREHLGNPYATSGLLEARPNRPLPWKGVLLVLIPGLVFLVGQVGQLNGKNWFFWATRRSAFYLIIPVLLVWMIARKFPIWGLIPLGVLFSAILGFGYRLQKGFVDRLTWLEYTRYIEAHSDNIRVAIFLIMFTVIIVLLWLNARKQNISRRFWAWLGVYIILNAPSTIEAFVFQFSDANYYRDEFIQNLKIAPLTTILGWFNQTYYNFYFQAAFLILILLGGLLAKRHGRLSILLPIGYILPIVLFGGPNYLPEDGPSYVMMISVILLYRFLLTLVVPTWIVRSASETDQKRASLVGLWSLVGFQSVMSFVRFAMISGFELFPFSAYYALALSDHLYIAVGIALAINLYQRIVPKSPLPKLTPVHT